MKPKLFYAGEAGDGFGWGVCNANLIRELGKLCELVEEPSEEAVCFMPIADHGLRPSSGERGWKNIGYTFFEYPLEECAAENAKQYDLIFCGSTWCQERLAERGIKHTKVLVQGVDTERFKPGRGRDPDGEVWIFSGGKFEFRKGQDLVLAAFKEVLKTHPRARLITAWRNPWPATMETMAESKHIKFELRGETWGEQLGHLCDINDIPKDRVLTLAGTVPNRDLPAIYQACDFGVFPNRCEGGTNLVMMEFMACGKAVVTNPCTGHMDLCREARDNGGMLLYPPATKDSREWCGGDYDIPSIVAGMHKCINGPDATRYAGTKGAEAMQQWTWERAARTIIENV